MSEEIIELYKKLNLNDKRNEYSDLIIKLNLLVNQLLQKKGIDINEFGNVKNYDIVNQKEETEEELLPFLYEDIWIIKNKILALLTLDDK